MIGAFTTLLGPRSKLPPKSISEPVHPRAEGPLPWRMLSEDRWTLSPVEDEVSMVWTPTGDDDRP
jgi:hypothetical protein